MTLGFFTGHSYSSGSAMSLVPVTGLYAASLGAFLANIHSQYTFSSVYAPGK